MKKALALLLCCVLLLTLAAGCKQNKPEELTDARITADVADAYHLYSYTHVVGTPIIRDMQVMQRAEEGSYVSLSVTADAYYDNAVVTVKAFLTYQRIDLGWKLENLTVPKATAKPTAAPDAASVMLEVSNYMSLVGSAYSVYGETYQPLYFNIANASSEISYEEGADTATLQLELHSEKLSFVGTYALTFGEYGWSIETVKQDDGRHHPLLRLTSLEQKDSK